MVHGLAGSAGVALLVLATIPDPLWGERLPRRGRAGTVAGMMLITAASALPFAYTAHRFAHLNRSPALTSGVASIGLGLFVAYQVGVADGLFARQPAWTPQ